VFVLLKLPYLSGSNQTANSGGQSMAIFLLLVVSFIACLLLYHRGYVPLVVLGIKGLSTLLGLPSNQVSPWLLWSILVTDVVLYGFFYWVKHTDFKARPPETASFEIVKAPKVYPYRRVALFSLVWVVVSSGLWLGGVITVQASNISILGMSGVLLIWLLAKLVRAKSYSSKRAD
jgi:hypothetical protein